MDLLNAVAAVTTCAAFLLAVWQFLTSRRKEATERERIALQRERLRNAAYVAASGAEAADLIVQRSKTQDVTIGEIQTAARMLRRNLSLLADQLQQEDRLLSGWRFGHFLMQSLSEQELAREGAFDGH
jgi:type III secretion system FlhB-like substrate exporter